MRRGSMASIDGADEPVNVAAMVDVVFILLAFFVLTTRFIGAERDLYLGQAQAAVGAGAQAADLPASVTIQLRPGSAGRVTIQMGQNRLAEGAFEQITARLRELGLPELPVVLAIDRRLPIATAARALDAVLDSPNQKVSLTALDE